MGGGGDEEDQQRQALAQDMQEQFLEYDVEDLRRRQEEILQVERDVNEIHDMFKELDTMVKEQGEVRAGRETFSPSFSSFLFHLSISLGCVCARTRVASDLCVRSSICPPVLHDVHARASAKLGVGRD